MEIPHCSKFLRSGRRCKNKAKYGNYCRLHIDKDEVFHLLELPEGAIYNIVQCVSDPQDLRNFALTSPLIKLFIARHIENMIKYELPLVNLFNIDICLAETQEQYFRKRALEIKKWNYLLFLAIGGLYINFKKTINNFYFNNKVITIDISEQWKLFKGKRLKFPIHNGLVYYINVKEITPTISYNSTFETTDFDNMEHFFWKTFMTN